MFKPVCEDMYGKWIKLGDMVVDELGAKLKVIAMAPGKLWCLDNEKNWESPNGLEKRKPELVRKVEVNG